MFPSEKKLHLLTVSGIPIKVDWSWLLIFILVTWSLAAAYFPFQFPQNPIWANWILGAVSAILLFFSILLHELSHSLVAQRNGLPIGEITLFIFGGVAQMSEEPDNPKLEFTMAAAGPLMSLLLVFVFYGLYYLAAIYEVYPPIQAVFWYLWIVNAVVLIFNLIPGLPLDGGRMFRALLWRWTGNLYLATRISSGIGSGLGVLLIVLGFGLTFVGNFLNGIWFVLIGFFLLQAARMSYQNVYVAKLLADVSVEEAMNTNPISVPSTTTLEDMVNNYFMKHTYRGYPVTREFGFETGEELESAEVMGFVTLNDVIAVDREDWKNVTAADLIRYRDLRCPKVDHNANLKDSLKTMVNEGHSCLMVLDNDKFKGVVSQQDIMSVIAMRAEILKEKKK